MTAPPSTVEGTLWARVSAASARWIGWRSDLVQVRILDILHGRVVVERRDVRGCWRRSKRTIAVETLLKTYTPVEVLDRQRWYALQVRRVC